MSRPAMFSKLGNRPEPKGALIDPKKTKTPFYSRVHKSRDAARQRYAELNFPINKNEPLEMTD